MTYLIFPAYNEKENLAKILPALYSFLQGVINNYKIVIIDDGSTDGTRDVAKYIKEPVPIYIISHEKNRGIGGVFKTIADFVNRSVTMNDFIIVLEADGTSDYTLIPKIIEHLQNGYDMVIASRYIKEGGYKNFPLKRYMLSLIGNKLLRILSRNRNITDYTIFYRGYRASIIKNGLSACGGNIIKSKTFLANTELLLNLSAMTEKIIEIPFIYSYDKKLGKSKMPVLKTLSEYLYFIAVRLLGISP